MKTTPLKLAGLIVASLAVIVGVASCGGSPPDRAGFVKNFEGTWILVGTDEAITGSADVHPDASTTLDLNVDGSAELDQAGQAETGTWTAESATDGKITGDNLAGSLTLKAEYLIFEDGHGTLVFARTSDNSDSTVDIAQGDEGFVGKWVWEEEGAPPAALELKKDGTAIYSHVGDVDQGTWEGTTETEGTFNGGAFVSEMKLDGENLILYHRSDEIVFVRKQN